MNDSFLLELPSILRKDIIFLSSQLANSLLKDPGRGTEGREAAPGGRACSTHLLVENGGWGREEQHLIHTCQRETGVHLCTDAASLR